MKAKKITDDFSVAEQLLPDDVDEMAAAGFKTIICNRPDGESADQPIRAEIQAIAEEHEMAFHYIPVVSGQLNLEDIAKFSEALDNAERPILAYCRTGTRSIQLWGLASGLKGMSPEEIVQLGAEHGYDLRGVAGWLAQQTQ
jgi:sulfide:quinone oxidoreductase